MKLQRRILGNASEKIKASFKRNASFLVFMVAVFAVRWSFADQYHVPTGSMEPTIHVGDRIYVNKAAFNIKLPFTEWILGHAGEPQRGDIVVFKSPEASGMTLVKRLIGLPGDHITVKDGFIFINGQAIQGSDLGVEKMAALEASEIFYSEKIGDHTATIKRTPLQTRHENFEFEVPQGHYFMMGDNRDNSYDSRYWGFVPRENLKGRASRVLWNFSLSDSLAPSIELNRFGRTL
jgi:signal peptidase I